MNLHTVRGSEAVGMGESRRSLDPFWPGSGSHFLGRGPLDTRALSGPGWGRVIRFMDQTTDPIQITWPCEEPGAIGGYVHPVRDADPFSPENVASRR